MNDIEQLLLTVLTALACLFGVTGAAGWQGRPSMRLGDLDFVPRKMMRELTPGTMTSGIGQATWS